MRATRTASRALSVRSRASTGVGMPLGKIPDESFQRNRKRFEDLLRAWRGHEEGAAVIPKSWEFDILDAKPITFLSMIEHHNRMIALTGLATFLHLGATGTGSFALSKTHGQFFVMGLRGILRYFLDVVTDELLRKFVDFNWGTWTRRAT